MTVLERGAPTPPGTLVFVPHDGRPLALFPSRLARSQAPGRHFPELPMGLGGKPLLGPIPRGAGWVLVPALVGLRSEFNALAPTRDKASDGSIGDTSHAAAASDHNPDESGVTPYEDSDAIDEVHAIDVDKDLKRAGWTMRRAVDIIVERHRSGADDRLQYVIFERKIASRSWGWTWRDYTGASPHTEHAHFSCRYTTAQESNTKPWGLLADEEDDMPTAKEVAAEVLTMLSSATAQPVLARAVLGTDGVIPAPGNPKPGKNADGTEVNTHWAGGTYAQQIYGAAVSARTYAAESRTHAANAVKLVQALAKVVQATTVEDKAREQANATKLQDVLTAIDQLPADVLTGLGAAAKPEDVAARLLEVYGLERSALIAALLADPA